MDDGLMLVFYLLALTYGIVLFLAVFRIWKISRLEERWMHTKMFYFSICICLLVCVVFFVLLMSDKDLTDDLSFFFLFLPV
jgi:hypothetical protein